MASNSGKRNRYLDARKRNGRINVEERGIRKGSLGAVSFLRDDSVINFLLAERERERESPFPLWFSSVHFCYTRCVPTMCPLLCVGREGERVRVREWASPKNGRFSMFSSLEDIDGPSSSCSISVPFSRSSFTLRN